MKNSPLLLNRYFVSDLHCSVNREHDVSKPFQLPIDLLNVEVNYRVDSNDARKWQLTMSVRFQPPLEQNPPYVFTMEIVGLFEVIPTHPLEKVEQLVKVNGASILFGAAREAVRTATSAGPFQSIILPSVSFYEAKTPLPAKPVPE